MEPNPQTRGPSAAYSHDEAVSFIWSVCNIIRDQGWHQSDYGDLILPFTVLRRLDAAAAPDRSAARSKYEAMKARGASDELMHKAVEAAVGRTFYNIAPVAFDDLTDDPNHLEENLSALVDGFSPNVRAALARFKIGDQIKRAVEKELLYAIVSRFGEIDLSPTVVTNLDMGYIFEELIRRSAENKNEEAGHHYTPREVIRLMVDLLLCYSDELLTTPGKIVTMLDPACGTGGMLAVADERLREMNGDVDFKPYGQDFDDESYAIAMSEQLMTGRTEVNVALGNSLTDQDAYKGRTFDFILANPPYGVSWKQYAKPIQKEHADDGFDGRYGAGLPSTRDGQLLFVQHMISKMQPVSDQHPGSRVAIIMNGSPLFAGDAGSGESEIRRWIIESDLLEAVIGLPNDLFYNTGISTYIWLLSNNKCETRCGRVQLIDARDLFTKRRKPLGFKRVDIGEEDSATIVSLYADEVESERSKWLTNDELGYQKVPIQRLRRALLSGGAPAVERLRASGGWNAQSAVRKRTADPDAILVRVEQAIAELPECGESLRDALRTLEEVDGWSSLLNSSQKAVADALMVDDPNGDPVLDTKGSKIPDPRLKGVENVPLGGDIAEHMATQVHPYAPDAWAEKGKVRIGYEIPFTEIFYRYESPPPLEEIDAELKALENDILELLAEVTE